MKHEIARSFDFTTETILNAISSAVVVFDANSILFTNACFDLLNRNKPEYLLLERIRTNDPEKALFSKSEMQSLAKPKKALIKKLRLFDKHYELNIRSITKTSDKQLAYVLTFEDITPLVQLGTRLEQVTSQMNYLVARDNLTDLLNIRGFQEAIENRFKRVKEKKGCFTIMFLDIDYFKNINDRYGHAVGDFVLKEVATIIRSHCKKSDLVCRAGGEEFIVYVEKGKVATTFILAEKIRKNIQNFMFVDHNHKFHITISIGIASGDDSFDSVNQVKENADYTMYQAKRAGRNQTRVFSE